MAWNIVFEPLIPAWTIALLALPGLAALAYAAFRRARGAPLRACAGCVRSSAVEAQKKGAG